MKFTLRQLEYAVAVGRSLHFGRAARACHVSQPALSAQIKELETSLQRTLFDRTGRRVAVTPFGKTFLRSAESLLERALALEELTRREGPALEGPLGLGALPTVAPYVLPPALPALAAEAPELRLRLVEAPTPELVRALRQGELDVILASLDELPGELEMAEVGRDPFLVALGPADAAQVEGEPVSLATLPQERLLLLDEPH